MAGSSGSFRELEDKPCSAEIHSMKWSPKMDLIALITAEGEVLIQRLSWKRVWGVSASERKAVCMAWRPDGKILCVGFKDGVVKLFDVENGESVHSCCIGESPTCMEWTEHDKELSVPKDIEKQPFNVDKAELLLPPLPSLPKSGETLFSKESSDEDDKDPKKLACLPEELNILTIGDSKGRIHVFLYGIFLCGLVRTESKQLKSVMFSKDLKVMSAVVQHSIDDDKSSISLEVYNSSLLNSRQYELSVIAKKIGAILTLLEYFNKTVTLMAEAWEDILLEMDTKLTTFASERHAAGSSVSLEFLNLLTKGTSSPELQSFLLHELTEKGLKKLGHNIENSYSSIQALALKHLHSVIQAFLFHLTELLGMAKWFDHYGILGLNHESVQASIRTLGTVILKSRELVNVIETSLKSFKAFFQWLYSVILRLSEEPLKSYLKQSNQEDVALVSHFLQNQLRVNEQGKFSLERVGQYFQKSSLSTVSSYGDTPWTRFVSSSHVLKNSPLILHHDSHESLVTLANHLEKDLEISFKQLADTLTNSFQCKLELPLATYSNDFGISVGQISMKPPLSQAIVMSHIETKRTMLINIGSLNDEHKLPIKAISFDISNLPIETDHEFELEVLDVQFYDSDTMTALLRDLNHEVEKQSFIVQIPLSVLQEEDYIDINGCCKESLVNNAIFKTNNIGQHLNTWRRIQGFTPGSIAVSGSRKVCCALSASRRRVKLFDMDAEDDDEEDDEMSRNETQEMDQNKSII